MPKGFVNYGPRESALFGAAVTVTGLAALKLTISSPAQWLIVLILLLGCALLSPVRSSPARACYTLLSKQHRGHFLAFLMPWMLLCIAVAISASLNEWLGWQALPKLVLLAAVLTLLLIVRPGEATVVVALQSLAVIALSILLVLWLADLQGWLVFVPNRYGWSWAPPGVFWKAGIYLLPLASWWIMSARYSATFRWGWLLVCCVIVGLDGSRTASLLALIIWAAVFGLGLGRFGFKRPLLRRGFLLAVVMVVSIGGINPSSLNPAYHVYGYIDAFFYGESGLAVQEQSAGTLPSGNERPIGRELAADSIRYAMLMDSLKAVVDHFPLGGGLGSTTTQTESMPEPMVVHMTYLQLLADVGVLGLLGYLGIFLVPLFYAMWSIRRAKDRWACFDRQVLPLGIIGIYLFSGLLHPVSTEISEWLIVLIGLSMLAPEQLALSSSEEQ